MRTPRSTPIHAALTALTALAALVPLGTAGCGSTGAGGSTTPSPAAAEARRFALDDVVLPAGATDFAADLDGSGRARDQLGNILAALASHGDDGSHSIPALLAQCVTLPALRFVEPAAGASPGDATVTWEGAAGDG